MNRRFILIPLLAVILLAAGAQVAFAWSNGPHDGGFGTHDLLLTRGAEWAGDNGKWLDLDEATYASELPDINRTSGFLHTFRPTGRSQGGPQECANLYYDAVVAYKAGDYKKASHLIGVMSHYYTDNLQPFHTNTFSTKNDDLHRTYERIYEDKINDPTDFSSYFEQTERNDVTDIRAKAVAAAVYSRSKAHILLPALRDKASISNSDVSRVTAQLFSRSANDLADIIASVPSGEGTASAPAKIGKRITKREVRLGSKVGLYTRCVDEKGDPIRAARIVFVWPTSTGTFKMVRYTDADGWVHDYRTISKLKSGAKTRVYAYQESSGVKKTVSEWFIPRR